MMVRSKLAGALVGALFSVSAACGADDTETTSASDAEVTTTTGQADATAVPDPDAVPLVGEFLEIDEGTFRAGSAGTEFTFTIDRPMFVPRNGLGWFVLAEPDSQGPDDRDIVVLRVSGLADPDRLDVPFAELEDPYPSEDFSGWLDRLPDEIQVTGRDEVTLGGLPAVTAQIELGDVDCGPGIDFCRGFATNHQISGKDFVPGSTYRIWYVDQGDEDPLAVVVGINREEDAEFFDTASEILDTLAFDEVAPNPMQARPTGEAELGFFGGIRTDFAQPVIVSTHPRDFTQDSAAVGIAVPGPDSVIGFLTDPRDPGGQLLESATAVVSMLETNGGVVTDVGSIDIAGVEARVIDVASTSGDLVLTFREDADDGWRLGPRARWWVMDHPERGLLVLVAEARGSDDVDADFLDIVGQAESIIGSLEFV